jgi:hypothetical protein
MCADDKEVQVMITSSPFLSSNNRACSIKYNDKVKTGRPN